MRVFLDANILFSAALPKSRLRAFLAVLSQHARCLTNAYAIEEACRNLALKKPLSLAELDKLTQKLELIPILITELEITLDAKGVPILGGAIAGHATHLLTGDEQDFGPWFGKTVQGVKIVSPQILARELVRRGWLSAS